MHALSKRNAAGITFNVCTGKTTTINLLSKTLQQIMNKTELESVHAKNRPGDIMHSYGDITQARRNLDYEPKVPLEKGLSELVKWYSSQ